jgi:DoxX-like protein
VTYALWFVQILLALLFLVAGGTKLALPIEALGLPFVLPAVFVRFIGMCEVLGALGLILPGALRIRIELTPLAALGLTTIMFGATMFTPPDELQLAILPASVGLLAASVAYGRWRIAPLHASSGKRAPAEVL